MSEPREARAQGPAVAGRGTAPVRAERRTRRLVAPVLLAGVAVMISACGNPLGTTHHENRDYDITDKVSSLKVSVGSGNIEVVGADVSKISVRERLSFSKKQRPTTRHDISNGHLTLDYKCPSAVTIGFSRCDVNYRVQVPRNLALTLDTGSGSLRASGVHGRVQASSDSGGIDAGDLRGGLIARTGSGSVRMTNVAGAVKVDTGSGGIVGSGLSSADLFAKTGSGGVSLRFTSAPSSVVAKTGSGGVDLVLPNNVQYEVTSKTGSGGQHIGVSDVPGAPRKIFMSSGSGSVSATPA